MDHERGFTLVEVIVSLGLFTLITVGSLGALGAIQAGGAVGATPVAVGAVRLSKDLTAAAVYLQAVQEYLTGLNASQLAPGAYASPFPPDWSAMPVPPAGPEQLGRASLVVRMERWYWDPAGNRYCPIGSSGCDARAAAEFLTRAASTLTWEFRGIPKTMTLSRFLP